MRLGGSTHITMPYFLETGISKAEILRFVNFRKGRRRHLGFLEIAKFYWLLG